MTGALGAWNWRTLLGRMSGAVLDGGALRDGLGCVCVCVCVGGGGGGGGGGVEWGQLGYGTSSGQWQ